MRTFCLLAFLILSNVVIAQTKVGIVNSQKVLDALPYQDSMIRLIEKIEREGIRELMVMDSLTQIKMASVPHNVSFDSPALEIYSKSLRKLQEDVQIREKEIDSQLMVIAEELNKTSLSIVKKAVQLVSETLGLSMVYDESTLLYFEDQLDITEQVIQQALKLE